MTSRVFADKSDDAEQQSISLLQSDAEAVSRDFRLRLTVLDLIEEGHKAAGIAISAALVTGVVLGLSLPVDHNIPGKKGHCAVRPYAVPGWGGNTNNPYSSSDKECNDNFIQLSVRAMT